MLQARHSNVLRQMSSQSALSSQYIYCLVPSLHRIVHGIRSASRDIAYTDSTNRSIIDRFNFFLHVKHFTIYMVAKIN